MNKQELNFYLKSADALESYLNDALTDGTPVLYYSVERLHSLIRDLCDPSCKNIPIQTFVSRLEVLLCIRGLSLKPCRFTDKAVKKQIRGFSIKKLDK